MRRCQQARLVTKHQTIFSTSNRQHTRDACVTETLKRDLLRCISTSGLWSLPFPVKQSQFHLDFAKVLSQFPKTIADSAPEVT